MQPLVSVIVNIVSLLLSALQLFMLVRAVLSWFPVDEDGPLFNFVYLVTEPVIVPIRAIVERFPSLRDLPLDLPLFFAMILLIILEALLPQVHF